MDEKTFNALAAAIAKALGGKVTRKGEPGQAWQFVDFTTAEGLPLDMRNDGNGGNRDARKLRFAVVLPQQGQSACRYSKRDLCSGDERAAGMPVTEICVSVDKGAERIAADIRRRLIPGATDIYARAVARRDADKAHADGKAATIARLCKALRCDANGETVFAPAERMRVNSATSVRFEHFSCTPDTALKIHALLVADKGRE